MNLGDLLTPWLELAAVLIILIYVEKWIHSHLYGVGWLLTNDQKTATVLYYLLLSPGVFVHEFTQYLVAGALNVKIKRVMAWPEAQDDGTLRLNFVQIKQANRLQAAIIGAMPFLLGLGLVWAISNRILNLEALLTALATADLTVIGKAVQDLASTPDFYLWLYLMFAISNAMLPTPADREGWPLLFAVFVGIIVVLVVIGTGDVLLKTFTGPVAHGVDLLTTAFATVLVVEISGIIVIGFAEEIAERITKRKFYYGKERAETSARERQPGSSDPLPAGTPMPSIYNLPLPVPTPSEIRSARKPVRPAADSILEPGAPQTARPPLPGARSFSLSESTTEEPAVDMSAAGSPVREVPARRTTDFAPTGSRPLNSPDSAAASTLGTRLSPHPGPSKSEEDEEEAPTSPFAAGRSARPAPGSDQVSRASLSSPAGGLPQRRSLLEPEDEEEAPASPFAPGRSARPAPGSDPVSRVPLSSPAGGPPQRGGPLEPEDEDSAPASPVTSGRFPRPAPPGGASSRPPLASPGGEAANRLSRPRPIPPPDLDDDDDEQEDEQQDDDNEVQYIPFDDV